MLAVLLNQTADTANVETYVSGSFTPLANDLLVVFVTVGGTAATPTLTDSQGIGFTRIDNSGNTTHMFLANGLAANSPMTVTFDVTGDAATGCTIIVFGISGMVGSSYRQVEIAISASSGIPAVTLPLGAANASSCLVGSTHNISSADESVAPTDWTKDGTVSRVSPINTAAAFHRNSGETNSTITWGFTSSTAWFAAVVEFLPLAPSGIVSEEAFGTASLSTGPVTVSPSSVSSSETFETPTITPGAVTLAPSAIASEEGFGTPTLLIQLNISPSGVASGESFGQPTLSTGPVTISPSSISSLETFGTPTVAFKQTILPTGIPSSEIFGSPTVKFNQVLTVPGIASAEVFGLPFVQIAVTYVDWIARSARANWYGLEGRIRREFSDWELHSGSVYKTSWPVLPVAPKGGRPFVITAVYANGVVVTPRANLAAVESGAAPDGWFHDPAVKPNQFYIKLTGGVNPYSVTVIGHFTVRFASGVPLGKISNDLNGVPWRVCVSQSSIPEIKQSLGNVFFGTAVFGSIKISFVNADSYFDSYYEDWLWKDSEWDLVHGDGGPELSYAQHRLTTFVCSNVDGINEREFTITLENLLQVLNVPVLQEIFDVAVTPNMDASLQGKWIPELIGEDKIPFYPIDLQAGKFKGTGKALDYIRSVQIEGLDVPYVADLPNGEITIISNVQNVTATQQNEGSLAAGDYYVQVSALVPDKQRAE